MLISAFLDRSSAFLWVQAVDHSVADEAFVQYMGVMFQDIVHPDYQSVALEAVAKAAFCNTRSTFCAPALTPPHPVGSEFDHPYLFEVKPLGQSRIDSIAFVTAHKLPDFSFTSKDQTILWLLTKDVPVKEIHIHLGTSESTVDARIKHLKERTGRRTLQGLVTYAIHNGLV